MLSWSQGPPGTGKTSTVVAVVSAILATAPMPQPAQQPGIPPARAAAKAAAAPQAKQPAEAKVRVLLCAQSNSAVDELVIRLADPGIVGADGQRR